jgi:hypothetical protein
MSLPTYKDIVDLIKKGETVEAQERIMELREAVIELKDENSSLHQRVQSLEEELRIKGQLKFEKTVYWLLEDEGKTGPFCQCCYDIDKKLARPQDYGSNWYCVACKQGYEKNY